MTPLAVRWLKFNFVGALGIAVQMGSFALFFSALHVPYIPATALAVEAAVLHNFVWHERFTWKDRTSDAARPRDVAMRLVRFHAGNGAVSILGNVYNDIGNSDGFQMECAQGVELGFDGKTLIHPNQIEPCNKAFSPSAEDVAQARQMIAAFDLPENKGKGVVSLDVRMVERLHADMARRTVAIAEAIAARP